MLRFVGTSPGSPRSPGKETPEEWMERMDQTDRFCCPQTCVPIFIIFLSYRRGSLHDRGQRLAGAKVNGHDDGVKDQEEYNETPWDVPDPTKWRGCSYKLSYLTIVSISFAGFVDYSVIMPSSQTYCQILGEGDTFYGLALATYPFARVFMLPVAGYLADEHSMRVTLLCTVGMQVVGTILYGCAQAAGIPMVVLLGRLLAGMGSTNNALSQKFVIDTTTTEERSQSIAILQAINLVGIALGPAAYFLLDHLDFQIVGSIRFTEYTGAGFFMSAIHIVNATLTLCCFNNPPVDPQGESMLSITWALHCVVKSCLISAVLPQLASSSMGTCALTSKQLGVTSCTQGVL